MQWLNEPVSWQRTADTVTVSVDPGTDFWRETGYGYIRDSGHVYGEVLPGDLDVSVRVHGTFSAQYDQAGVMLRADDRVWLKTGVEFFDGRPRLSTVLTLSQSSWTVTDLPDGTDEVMLRVSRRGDAVEVRYEVADGPAELAALVFLPPDREVLAGVMCAAPEGPGFAVTFENLCIAASVDTDGDEVTETPPAEDAGLPSAAESGYAPEDPEAPGPGAPEGPGPGKPAVPEPGERAVPEPASSRSGPFPVLGRWARKKPAGGEPAPQDEPAAPEEPATPADPADEWVSLLTADPESGSAGQSTT